MGPAAYACQPDPGNRMVRRDAGRNSRYVGQVTEVPEADRQEQDLPVVFDDFDEDDDAVEPAIGDDVPEADAVEQAQVVPLDDDYE